MRTWAAVLQTILDAMRPTPLSHVMTSYDVYQAGPGDGGPTDTRRPASLHRSGAAGPALS